MCITISLLYCMYRVSFTAVWKHDDCINFLLVNHRPEVPHGVCQWGLCHYEGTAAPVSLCGRQTHRVQTKTMRHVSLSGATGKTWQEAVCHSLTSAGIFSSLYRNGFINWLNGTVMCEALMYWVESSSSSSEESSSSSSSSGSLSWLRPSSSFRNTRLKSSAGFIWQKWNWADVILHVSTRVHAKTCKLTGDDRRRTILLLVFFGHSCVERPPVFKGGESLQGHFFFLILKLCFHPIHCAGCDGKEDDRHTWWYFYI